MENRIKVRCIKPNKYGFIVGHLYDGYIIKSAIKNKNDIISVINKFGEEYAYPAELFKVMCSDREEYICDDRPIAPSEKIAKMTDAELEVEFQKRFGKYNVEK